MDGEEVGNIIFIMFSLYLSYFSYIMTLWKAAKNQPEPEKLYVRPADKSLAAYKGSILS